VLREAFLTAWPRFVLPRRGAFSNAALSLSPARDVYTVASDAGNSYEWCFTRPLRLASVMQAGRPVGVTFIPSSSGSVQVGVFLVHSAASPFLDAELRWNPYIDPLFAACGGACCVTLGACGGALKNQRMDGERTEWASSRSIGGRSNERYGVEYHPKTGEVRFLLGDGGGKLHGSDKIEDEQMVRAHSDAVLLFAVGVNAKRTVQLLARKF
jgi:hypothetical protein